MPGYFGETTDDQEDPLLELRKQMGLSQDSGRTPAAPRERAPGAPVDERDLSERSRTFYDPNFVNEGRYREANAGEGMRMAGALASSVGGKGQTAKDAIAAGVAKFGAGVKSDIPAFSYAGDQSSPSGGRQDLSGSPAGKAPSPSGMPTGPTGTTKSSTAPTPTGSTSQALGGTPQKSGSTTSSAPSGPADLGGKAPTGGGGTPGTVPGSTYSYARPAAPAATTAPPAGQSATTAPKGPPAPASIDPYAGVTSLLEQSPELAEQAKVAGQEANQLGNDVSRQKSLQDLYGKNASYYGMGSSGLDSMLAGAEGFDKLNAVKKEYGGLEDMLKAADKQSIADVAARKGRDTGRAEEAAKVAADKKARIDKDIAEKQAADKAAADKAAPFKGKKSFKDYTTENAAESTVRDIGEAFDPSAWFLHAIGKKSLEEMVTPGADAYANKNYGTQLNSSKVRFQQRMGSFASPTEIENTYNTLTAQELQQLEGMSEHDQEIWLRQRYDELKKSGYFDKLMKDTLAAEDAKRVQDELNNPPTVLPMGV
jgi:hypothetical protein